MNRRLEQLMLEAGYAAPQLATRAQKLAVLVVQECIDIIAPYAIRMEDFDGNHPINEIKKTFGTQND